MECLGLYFALLSFHEYIHLRKVKIRSDHSALQYLMSKRVSDSPRLRAWTHLISVYNPEITYLKGAANTVADALSRRNELAEGEPAEILADQLVFAISTWNDLLSTHQATDPECLATRKLLMEKMYQGHRQYVEQDGILMRFDAGYKPLVPLTLRKRVMEAAHTDFLSGHRGALETKNRVRQEYYWPGLSRDIEDFVSKCDPCGRIKSQPALLVRTKPASITMASSPAFERIQIDVKGPLAPTTRGNVYIISFIDLATRYLEAFASPSQSTAAVATLLSEGVIARHGVPKQVFSDRGTCFTSTEFAQLVSGSLGAHHTLATAYAHWSSGAIERIHRNLSEFLRIYELSHPESEWDRLLPYAVAAYNTATHSIIGTSPFAAVFGRKFRSPLAPSKELFKEGEAQVNPLSWITQTATRIKQIHEFAARSEATHRAPSDPNETPPITPGTVIRPKAQGLHTKHAVYLAPKTVLSSTPHRVTVAAPSIKNPARTVEVHVHNLKKSAPFHSSTDQEPVAVQSAKSEHTKVRIRSQLLAQGLQDNPKATSQYSKYNSIMELIDERLDPKTQSRSYLSRVSNELAQEWFTWLPLSALQSPDGSNHPALRAWSNRSRDMRHGSNTSRSL
jgi:hypothetical protein